MLVPGATLVATVIVVQLASMVFGSPLMSPLGQGKCIHYDVGIHKKHSFHSVISYYFVFYCHYVMKRL
jgi:hypothetical protein